MLMRLTQLLKSKKRKNSDMENLQEAIAKIESHERECSLRYANIERRLESGSKRFDKLENMIWGVYPFIVVSVILAKFL